MILTYRYRIKDGGSSTRRRLRAQARAVNFVWNYCCEIDREARSRWKAGRAVKRPSAFDLASLCRGVTRELGIHSDTVDAICRKFADARRACFPKTPRFRSFKHNLDFVPFSNFKRPAKLDGGNLTVFGSPLSPLAFASNPRGRQAKDIRVLDRCPRALVRQYPGRIAGN